MPRNGTKATPKDLLTELARRKDGVTHVRAYISGIAGSCPQHASLDFAHASRGGAPCARRRRRRACVRRRPGLSTREHAVAGGAASRADRGTVFLRAACRARHRVPRKCGRVSEGEDGGVEGPELLHIGLAQSAAAPLQKGDGGRMVCKRRGVGADAGGRFGGAHVGARHPSAASKVGQCDVGGGACTRQPRHTALCIVFFSPVEPTHGPAHTRQRCNHTTPQVHVPSDKEVRSLSVLSRALSLQPPEEEASNTHENLPEANAHHGEALAPTDQPASAQNQMSEHHNMPFSQMPPANPNENTPTIIPVNQLPSRSSHGVAQAPPALAPAQNQMEMHQQIPFESEQERTDARATLASMGFPRNAITEPLLRKHCNSLDAVIAEPVQAAMSGASMGECEAQLAPAPLSELPARSSHAAVGLSHAAVAPSPSTPATSAFAPLPGRRQAGSHRQGVLRDSSQANTRFDFHKGGGLGLGKAASAAGGMCSASTAAAPAASVTYSPAPATYSPRVCSGLPQSHSASFVDVERPSVGLPKNPGNLFAMTSEQPVPPKQFSPFVLRTNSGLVSPIAPAGGAHGSLAGAVDRPVGDFANIANGFEISAGASAASGQSGSETLSGRKRCHSTMAGPHAALSGAQDEAAADCGEKCV